jgi:hypothetical protein
MTTQEAKALIGLCVHEGLKQGVLKGRGEFEELLDYLDKYFIDTDKRASGSSEIPKDLEEASSKFATHTAPNGVSVEFLEEKLSFQEGAKWQKEQMMKEVVEMEVGMFGKHLPMLIVTEPMEMKDFPAKHGQTVRVIVLQK